MIDDQHGLAHAIPIQSGSIAVRIKVEDFGKHSLLPFLNRFGRLYYGTVNATYFNTLFQEKKQQFLKQLNSTLVNQDLEFQLRMSRIALDSNWKWPAFVNVVHLHGQPEWATGGSRILASGLCKENPEQTILVLFFDQIGIDVDQWIESPIEITTDEQLHQVLGLVYTQTQSPVIQISTVLKQINDHTRLFLHGIIDEELEGDQNSQELEQLPLLDNLRQWQSNYQQPQLDIYTDWPELISDSLGVWNYRVVGNIAQFAHQLYKPGHLERLARVEHEQKTTRGHILYIREPRAIDLTEFLVWVDVEHTTFIDKNWDFLLYRNGLEYKSTMISFSSV